LNGALRHANTFFVCRLLQSAQFTNSIQFSKHHFNGAARHFGIQALHIKEMHDDPFS
jgi:hypothetical protein